ncbi:MAG: nucleotidyltransferase domain-containing protein [Methanomassiliicoccaceae archaeon]|nr:nucleotidyltransferase domain-containing protein [Methanomassiliicoccaceae archaeon]
MTEAEKGRTRTANMPMTKRTGTADTHGRKGKEMKVSEAAEIAEKQTRRNVAICSLVGSRNYNLHTESSDHDFIVFAMPTLDDMYERNEYLKEIKGDGYEIRVHDLRKLPDLLCKSNPSYVEIIFSRNNIMNGDMYSLLYDNRERIAGMNLPYIYASSVGMFLNRMKYLEKGTGNTQHLVDMHGYDTKQAMQAYRILSVLRWFADHRSFEKAIRYDDNGEGKEKRELLMDIRNGKFPLTEMRRMLDDYLRDTEDRYKKRYLDTAPDKEMMAAIRDGVKGFILSETKKEVCRAQREG